MSIKYFQVDAFTNEAFSGNSACVCLLSEPKDDKWMQNVAFEMNLSETAFLYKQKDGFSLRWFTPEVEVDLCGHATLASAHTLWESGLLNGDQSAVFNTRSGLLTAERKGDLIKIDFPSISQKPAEAPEALIHGLGVIPKYVGKFGNRYLIEVETEEQVRELNPNFSALRLLPERGVTVTSSSTSSEYDFVSRYFAPWVGVDEDPVTGSVHCCLGQYWCQVLGKKELIAYQASKRGGTIHIRVEGRRVYLSGHAVTVASGVLQV